MFQVILSNGTKTSLFFNTNNTEKIIDWLNLQLFQNKGNNLGLFLNEDWNCHARQGNSENTIIISGDEDFKTIELIEVKPIKL